MPDDPPLVRVFITIDPLATGEIPEVWAKIQDDVVTYGSYGYCAGGEGRAWHRTRSAAESYARQLQMERIRRLRDEIDRLERLRFGRPGA